MPFMSGWANENSRGRERPQRSHQAEGHQEGQCGARQSNVSVSPIDKVFRRQKREGGVQEEVAQRNPAGIFYLTEPPPERATGLLISISNIQLLSNHLTRTCLQLSSAGWMSKIRLCPATARKLSTGLPPSGGFWER